jgi:hypothetical protein
MENQAKRSRYKAAAPTQRQPELLSGKEGLLNNLNPCRYAEI